MSLSRLPLLVLLALLALGCNSPGEVLQDFDGDGSLDADDCEPADASIHPSADDPYGDGIDQDCDGADLTDVDGDGVDGGPYGTDCDDNDPDRYPDAPEDCEDGVDGDCDGVGDNTDEDCSDPADDDEPQDCTCQAQGRGAGGAAAACLLLLTLAGRRRGRPARAA